MIISTLVQFIMAVASATVSYAINIHPDGDNALIIIGMLGFASGMQLVAVKRFKIPEFTSAVLTSTTVELFADPKLFQLRNPERNNRVISLLVLFCGVVVGHVASVKVNAGTALMLSAGIRLMNLLVWFPIIKEKKKTKEEKSSVINKTQV
eukprot:TRINITY_DN13878_c0_g1_i1.p1 TRINITY_DN13878_c0_g1~~TRINITY_DN13878_c0_g1_i1.p1  ORF type:complete len:151 (-),score=42.70 TRINITY_DN13878_c0_g1_i1:34-486(-)